MENMSAVKNMERYDSLQFYRNEQIIDNVQRMLHGIILNRDTRRFLIASGGQRILI